MVLTVGFVYEMRANRMRVSVSRVSNRSDRGSCKRCATNNESRTRFRFYVFSFAVLATRPSTLPIGDLARMRRGSGPLGLAVGPFRHEGNRPRPLVPSPSPSLSLTALVHLSTNLVTFINLYSPHISSALQPRAPNRAHRRPEHSTNGRGPAHTPQRTAPQAQPAHTGRSTWYTAINDHFASFCF